LSARPVALVTRALSGIGAALADRLARDGDDLIVVARRRDRLGELAARLTKETGSSVRVLAADLATDEGIRSVEAVVAAEPDMALVVNNAGFSGYRPFVELEADIAEQLIRIHCVAPTRITRAGLPRMIERGEGGILNIGSLLAFSQSLPPDPLPHRATYAACKAFMVTFTFDPSTRAHGNGRASCRVLPGHSRI
jgi:short-subunit dehydrogenase